MSCVDIAGYLQLGYCKCCWVTAFIMTVVMLDRVFSVRTVVNWCQWLSVIVWSEVSF